MIKRLEFEFVERRSMQTKQPKPVNSFHIRYDDKRRFKDCISAHVVFRCIDVFLARVGVDYLTVFSFLVVGESCMGKWCICLEGVYMITQPPPGEAIYC
ncbi:hypothetical protein ASPWEDRAFT_460204 [Aspergillus wentii DTO 134E9]|uniref:Uncharacterized protein n=1 Tax=Aspergillus wentii DTO 134E9 TaxID=1073089 RepID=A0A1L9RRM0_ASPWE|nr:uncharacterized protein ASPWEDRAFT_460204 [Aspergillus wentii DTO 134E9]OJJ37575.1 hypothetical protein ASPWEDRAFT_460204 [Aspergillus wentii DTO 134E9]